MTEPRTREQNDADAKSLENEPEAIADLLIEYDGMIATHRSTLVRYYEHKNALADLLTAARDALEHTAPLVQEGDPLGLRISAILHAAIADAEKIAND